MDLTVKNNRLGKRKKSLRNNKKNLDDSKSHYFAESNGYINFHKSLKVNAETLIYANTLRLNNSFFSQSCTDLAKALLGKILVRKLSSENVLKGKIVETESYLGVIDAASHSFNGKKTDRNEAMFLKPGTAYVYSIYGMYYCFNISSLEEGSAVLIRALEPLEGISLMQEFRSKGRKSVTELKVKELCNGPSKLCQAFKIEKNLLNKVDLCVSDDLWLEDNEQIISPSTIISCKRIGIDSYGEEWANKPLRFYIKGNIYVSRRCKISEKAHEELFSSV